MPLPVFPDEDSFVIRNVWSSTVDQEFDIIRDIVDEFPYIAMDTEFPGIVVHNVGANQDLFNYETLRDNVNILKLIQLGLTFSDEHGNHPSVTVTDDDNNQHQKFCVWQFNFREFNIKEDACAHDSIELLVRSGIDFRRNIQDGIDVRRFGELLTSSGVVLNDSVHWVTFHSAYDFGYLLKLLKGKDLPEKEDDFLELIKVHFPRLYDMKYLMKFCYNLHGGLNKLAEALDVRRIGVSHQAGSDSLLTCHTFIKLKELFFNGSLDKYSGVLFGLGIDASGSSSGGGGGDASSH